MATRSTSRNNIIAGLFVLICVVMAVVISIILSGVMERLTPTTPYAIRFPLEIGASGIEPGSSVLLGGQKVGRVTGVAHETDEQGEMVVRVSVLIDSSVELYTDAWVALQLPLLGTLSTINISDVGGDAGERLASGGVLAGKLAPPVFLTAAGFGPTQIAQFQDMIADATELIDLTRQAGQDWKPKIDAMLTEAHETLDNVNTISADTRQRLPGWSDHVDATLGNVEVASEHLPPLAEDARSRVTEAREVIVSVQETIDESRPKIDATLDNVASATGKIDRETIGQVNDTLTKARDGIDSFTELTDRVRRMIEQELPGVQRMLAALRLAAEQFKLTSVEVRRAPWRLLYKPKTKELESELLFGAARSYAQAASDLRAASEALQVALADGDGRYTPQQQEELTALSDRLENAMADYRKAEKELFQYLTEQPR
jgi:ABC-type transporter Mla subunit MlaD